MQRSVSFAQLRPGAHEHVVLVNLLGLLALPLLAYLIFLGVNSDRYVLEIPLRSDAAFTGQLGFEGAESAIAHRSPTFALALPASHAARVVCVELPPGPLGRVRLRLISGERSVLAGPAIIRSEGDEVLGLDRACATLGPETYHAGAGITVVRLAGGSGVQLDRDPTVANTACTLDPPRPLELGFNLCAFAAGAVLAALLYAGLALAGLIAWRRLLTREPFRRRGEHGRAALQRAYAATGRFTRERPVASIWLMALAGVLLSCYPIVFCARSFVSPNLGTTMLYDRYPALPGGTHTIVGQPQGSDVSAMLWAFAPYAVVQHRAIFEDHEFPFWNRYNAGGQPLLGQGQSMLGDPLHSLLLLGGTDASAWDIKFLVAKLLFAAGVGLMVRAATGHQPTALLLGFSACFLGFFNYRFDHPAYFGMCYAPWVLLAWLEIARGGAALRWLGLLVLANWCVMNSGTVKEAYMLLPTLNGGGLLMLSLSGTLRWRDKGRAFAALLWVGACFALISAPRLVDAFRHHAPRVEWIRGAACLANPARAVRRIIRRHLLSSVRGAHEHVLDPSANFVVLLGVAFAAAAWKTLVVRERTFLAAGLSAAAAVALLHSVSSRRR